MTHHYLMSSRVLMRQMLIVFSLLTLFSINAAAEKRVALVIGNGDYDYGALNNALNDARDIAKALKSVGFKVILKENADRRTMLRAMRDFGESLQKDSVGTFFYSGHAVQFQGKNYLLPANAPMPTGNDIDVNAVRIGRVLEEMSIAGNGTNILILDACRDNPFDSGNDKATTGLAKMAAPAGTLIAYSTAPGQVAQDGGTRNSPYTKHLVHFIQQPNLAVGQMFNRVRNAVLKDTQKRQIPSEESYLREDFYFAGQVNQLTLAQQETERLLDKLRAAENKKLAANLSEKNIEQMQRCLAHEKATQFIKGSPDTPNEHALNCYQSILNDDPNNIEARARLVSMERRFRAWVEGALRHGLVQKARTYYEGLKQINPKAIELPKLNTLLNTSEKNQQEQQQMDSLTDLLGSNEISTDIFLNDLQLEAKSQTVWTSTHHTIQLLSAEHFLRYIPLPTLHTGEAVKIQWHKKTLPDWLQFDAEHLNISGIAPKKLPKKPYQFTLSTLDMQGKKHYLELNIEIKNRLDNAPLRIAHIEQDNIQKNLLTEVISRIFMDLGYTLNIENVTLTQAQYGLNQRNFIASYPLNSNVVNAHQLTSLPLPTLKNIATETTSKPTQFLVAHADNIATQTLLHHFNKGLKQLKNTGQLAQIIQRY